MPVYEYQCRKCHAVVEARVARMGDQPDLHCACGSADFERILSLPGVITSAKSSSSFDFGGCDGCDDGPCDDGSCGMGPCAGGACPF